MPLLYLAKKVKAEVVGQVSEIADQVGYHVLVATSAVLLKNRDSLGGPDDMVGSVSHVAPGLNGRATSQVSVFGNSNGAPGPAPTCQAASSTPAIRE